MTPLTDRPRPGGQQALARRYRRLLACYPRAFRREQADELVDVLMSCASSGRDRPTVRESANLIFNGLWLRLAPRDSRRTPTVLAGVRLMYLGAFVDLCVTASILLTLGRLHAAILVRDPGYSAAQWHTEVLGQIVPLVAPTPLLIAVWLWLARANDRGRRAGRIGIVALLGTITVSFASGLKGGAATLAPADTVAGAALWLVALAAAVLVLNKRSRPHYR